MSKPNRGKTKTIKDRTIYIYLPTLSMVKDWKTRAEKAGASISKFVMERVEDSLKKEEGEEGYLSRIELIKKLGEIQDENKSMKEENRMLKRLAENLDKELRRYRAKPFVDEGFRGMRRFEKEFIELLKKGQSLNEERILSELGIDVSDVEMVKAVNKQLEALEGYGLVGYRGRGWRWKG